MSFKNKLSALPWVRWRDPITMQVDLGTFNFNLLATSQMKNCVTSYLTKLDYI